MTGTLRTKITDAEILKTCWIPAFAGMTGTLRTKITDAEILKTCWIPAFAGMTGVFFSETPEFNPPRNFKMVGV